MMTVLMIVLIVVSNAAGDVYITKGMKQVGEVATLDPRELLAIAKRAVTNGNMLLGIFFLAVSFFSFLSVLSWAEMSFVVTTTASVYVVAILGAKFILKERISALRWVGTLLVCVGVALICMS